MISFKDYCKRVDEINQLDESASRFIQKVNQAANAAASGKHKNAQMHLDNARSFMLGVKSTDMEKIKDAHETYKNLRKKYSGSGGNFTPSHNQVGNAKVSESEELEEGSIANIDQKLKDHAQRKIDHETKYGQMNGADLYSHEVIRTRLLQQKKKLQSAKMRAESVELDEVIKGWKHAHTDLMKSRAAASSAAKPIHLHILTKSGSESKMEGPQGFNSHEDAQAHVDNMHKMNPGKKFSYNKYENGKHVGVVTKSTNESVELDEEEKVDHSVAQHVAKNLGLKLKSFSHGKYNYDGKKIPGNLVYTFNDDVTHKDVHAALAKSGFKPPRHGDVMTNHESMTSHTNSAVSPTHTAHTTQEHGGPLKLHIQARNKS